MPEENKHEEQNMLKMLIVDDIEMNRAVLKEHFHSEFNIYEAEQGVKALEILAATQIDIVITDIFMPVMNGLELIRRIKANQKFTNVVSIAITEWGEDFELRALEAGADDFINKPFRIELLRHRINSILSNNHFLHRLVQQRFAFNYNRIPFATVSVSKDTAGKIIIKYQYINEAYTKMLKQTTQQLMSEFSSDDEIYQEFGRFLIDVIAENHKKTTIYNEGLDTYFDVQAYSEGNGFCSILLSENEAQKAIQAEKKRTNSLWQEMVELYPDAFAVILLNFQNKKFHIIYSNEEELNDKSGGLQLLFDSLYDIISLDEEKIRFHQFFSHDNLEKQYKQGKYIIKQVFITRREEEASKVIELSIHLHQSDGGEESVLLCRDITEERLTQQLLDVVLKQEYDTLFTINLVKYTATVYCANGVVFWNEPYCMKNVQEYISNYLNVHYAGTEKEQFIEDNRISVIAKKMRNMNRYDVDYDVFDNNRRLRRVRCSYYWLDKLKQRICVVRKDVTKEYLIEKENEKRLENLLNQANAANQAKSRFLSRISHDMRTPLNGILGLTQFIKEKKDWTEIQKDIQQLEISGRYLLNLINDTLDVAKIESGEMTLHPNVCDGKMLLETYSQLIAPSVKAKKLHFQYNIEQLPTRFLYIDDARFQQLLTNIIGNAIKFTPEGGHIIFKMENVDDKEDYLIVRLIICDDGIGMSQEFLQYIFEPFSQEDNHTTSSSEGTGLGMSISKKIVELMNGTIDIKSERNQGTEVTILVELMKATSKQIEEFSSIKNVEADISSLKNKRVLLCEDHPLNIEIATRLLEQVGLIVEHAENGEAGVSMFENSAVGHYDAILMDIRMPIMDGIEATRKIRSSKKLDAKTIPILAMTANALNDDVKESLKAGMNYHISKPIDSKLLYRKLVEYIH